MHVFLHYRNYRSWHSRSIAPLKDLVYSSAEESIPIPDYDWKCPACRYHHRLLIYVCEVYSSPAPEESEKEKPSKLLSADESARTAVLEAQNDVSEKGGQPEILKNRLKINIRAASYGLLKRLADLAEANDIMAILDLMTDHHENLEVQLMGCMSLSTVILYFQVWQESTS